MLVKLRSVNLTSRKMYIKLGNKINKEGIGIQTNGVAKLCKIKGRVDNQLRHSKTRL